MHVSVTVHLSADRLAFHDGDFDDALEDILDTYDAEGDEPPRMVFVDREAAWREEHASAYFADRYASFEDFCRGEYDQCEPNRETGRWGYWENANAQWDFWRIGGRWTGYYPLRPGVPVRVGAARPSGPIPRPGFGDIVRPWEIDADAVERIRSERAEAFATSYVRLLEMPDASSLGDDDRNVALRLRLLRCHEGPASADEDHLVFPWFAPGTLPGDSNHPRASWTAIARRTTRDRIIDEHGWLFDPLPTFVALNDDGWHAPDMSAWFALSDEDPEATRVFQRTFVDRFIRPAGPKDWLVLVDCHL